MTRKSRLTLFSKWRVFWRREREASWRRFVSYAYFRSLCVHWEKVYNSCTRGHFDGSRYSSLKMSSKSFAFSAFFFSFLTIHVINNQFIDGAYVRTLDLFSQDFWRMIILVQWFLFVVYLWQIRNLYFSIKYYAVVSHCDFSWRKARILVTLKKEQRKSTKRYKDGEWYNLISSEWSAGGA